MDDRLTLYSVYWPTRLLPGPLTKAWPALDFPLRLSFLTRTISESYPRIVQCLVLQILGTSETQRIVNRPSGPQ